MKDFKLVLREYCHSRGITLAWVARQLDVDEQTVHYWASNKTTPRLNHFLLLLSILRCEIEDIVRKVESD